MGNLKLRKSAILIITLFAVANMVFPPVSFAEEKVKVEAVGFFSHYPMQSTRQAIESACEKFGDKVELRLYDETTDEGQEFLSKVGLSGHIPMALYVDGKISHSVDGKTITFRDFVGQNWSGGDLEKVIDLRLKGVDTASKETGNQEVDQQGSTSEPPPNTPYADDYNQYETYNQENDTGSGQNNVFATLMYGLIGIVLLALIAFLVYDRKYARKRRS